MYWEEKIERLKKTTDPKDFRDPFTEGLDILKKIHDRFLTTYTLDYNEGFQNWPDGLKDKEKVKELLPPHLHWELTVLDPKQNYWIVLAEALPGKTARVYDAKPAVILTLVSLWQVDFYIGDKKYNWLVHFKRSPDNVAIYKASPATTPWDALKAP
ncbi:hypothetical protein [Chryseolinea soli]|uniref:Uncharacterized protein n=1 Tax=Chryseolinea soli TaxID=2321403 RepID=A0A385SR63_9BACT|nr:hypothetical protein [Chryseolinea soli]AYB33342.1 hypothetical protein D4L85_23355 [Chryseolinea soli]